MMAQQGTAQLRSRLTRTIKKESIEADIPYGGYWYTTDRKSESERERERGSIKAQNVADFSNHNHSKDHRHSDKSHMGIDRY